VTSLSDLLAGGFDAAPPSTLADIAADTKDKCWATGDVRYCIVSDCLEILDSCWGDDGAVRSSVVADLDQWIRGELAQSVAEPDPEAGRYLALSARSSLIALITTAGDLIYG